MTARVCVDCGTPVSHRSTARCHYCAMALLGEQRSAAAALENEELHALLNDQLNTDPCEAHVDDVCLTVGLSPSRYARRMQAIGAHDAARVLWRREQAWSTKGGWAACQLEAARAEVRSWSL